MRDDDYYILFAVMGGSVRALILESIVMSAFVCVAVLGFRLNLWLVVVALAAHGVFDFVGLEAHVKDEARFPTKWAFFDLGTSAPSAKPLPANSSGQTCHAKSGAVDNTFVQFYPTLMPIAKAKGTFKSTDEQ
jgi:hypothetical protein